MHIIFDAIRINGTPIIWDYDEDNNRIVCEFHSTDAIPSNLPKQDIIDHLKALNIAEIKLFDSHAYIMDAQTFLQHYRYSIVDALLDSPRCSSTDIVDSTNQSTSSNYVPPLALTPSFFSKLPIPKQIHSAKEAQEPPSLPCTYSLSCDSFKNLSTKIIPGISLDELIPRVDQSTFWSDTLSYETYFLDTINHQRYVPKWLKSLKSLDGELTKKQSFDLYPLRKKLIITLRSFFDNYLTPAFAQLRDNTDTQELALNTFPYLIAWLRTSLVTIMKDSPIIFGKVEFETMSLNDRGTAFDSQYSYERAVKQAYLARINPRLEPLLFFIMVDLPSHEITTNSSLEKCLDALKEKTTPYINDMTICIGIMQDLLINILKNQYQRSLEQQNQNIAISKHQPINGFVSFYGILKLILVEITKSKVDDDKLHQIIPTIIKTVIRSNNNQFCHFHNHKIIDGPIAKLTEDDQDFYLDQNICFLLHKRVLDNTRLCTMIQKNITKHKLIANISDQLGILFNSTLEDYLKCNPPINDSYQEESISVSSYPLS